MNVMARTFAITTTAPDPLPVNVNGHAEAVFTVTNTTSRPVRGMAKPKPLGDTKREWLSIQGDAERDFAPAATHQFTITFDAPTEPAAISSSGGPPTAGATAHKYPFRIDVATAINPEDDFTEGPSVTAAMSTSAPVVKSNFPFWIIPVVAVLVIAIGITLWLLLRPKKVEVPNVVGKSEAEATTILKEHKLEAKVTETKVSGTVAAGQVATQSPGENEKVAEGSAVELIVEAAPSGPTVLINFADSASSALWLNDQNTALSLTSTHDGLPQGSVVPRDGETLENDTKAEHVIETHPRWDVGGKLTGTYTLPGPLNAGDRFRTQIGFLKGAASFQPSCRLRLLFNGSVIDEITKGYDSSLRNWTVSLDDYKGQSGKFSLQVVAIPSPNAAWICWINPRIER
jgi:PASTA domain